MRTKWKFPQGRLFLGDCLEVMRRLPENSVDLVFGSPPYEDRRFYGIDFKKKGQEWVDWLVPIWRECQRVCTGMVAMVVGHGVVEDFSWSGAPALLCTSLLKEGFCLRDPKWYYRSGIPGSGGPDDLRKVVEWIVCTTKGGKLPWSDNRAMGTRQKYPPGGNTTHRRQDGTRVHTSVKTCGTDGQGNLIQKKTTRKVNEIAIATNLIVGNSGGGHMGSELAHEGDAPFPEYLANYLIRTFCKPEGVVLDPFLGTGTTAGVAIKTGRKFIGIDIRDSQIDLSIRRVEEATRGFGILC